MGLTLFNNVRILDGSGGNPVPGSPGLADTMAQLKLNFDVLKGQMGFNNPQIETNRFSLRRELFRIPEGEEGDAAWRAILEEARVDDLWTVPEFRRFARPFAPESAGPQPERAQYSIRPPAMSPGRCDWPMLTRSTPRCPQRAPRFPRGARHRH
jgi:hypothetical protein